jgi:hypothetical protein
MDNKIITNFQNYSAGANPSDEGKKAAELIDPQVIQNLVDIVGSEEEVEAAAKEAHEELKAAFEKNEVDLKEGDSADSLAMAALVLKLVEMGKLGPQEADTFIEENLAGKSEEGTDEGAEDETEMDEE